MPAPYNLIHDENAADTLPLRFALTAMLLLMLMGLAYTGISAMVSQYEHGDTIQEAKRVVSAAQQLSARGEGSSMQLSIEVPGHSTLCFGALPSETFWPDHAKNYYVMTGGKTSTFISSASFCNQDVNGPVILYPGPHELIIESVKDETTGLLFIRINEA